MIILKNNKDLETALSQNLLLPLFMSEEVEKEVLDAINRNLELLTENYGCGGDGGYIAIITDPIDDAPGKDEYFAELEKYHLSPDCYEFEDRLGTVDGYEVLMELYVLTEFNTVIIFRKKVSP